MEMRALALAACGWTLAAATVQAQEQAPQASVKRSAAEVALSDQTLQLRYITDGKRIDAGNSVLSFGAFLSEDRDVVLSAGVQFPTDLNFGQRFSLSLGPEVYAALLQEENNDVFALALGAQLRYEIVSSRGLALVGRAYYAPDITTFGTADNLVDLEARLEFRLAKRVVAFGGYRWFDMDQLMGQKRELQDELLAGIRYQFD